MRARRGVEGWFVHSPLSKDSLCLISAMHRARELTLIAVLLFFSFLPPSVAQKRGVSVERRVWMIFFSLGEVVRPELEFQSKPFEMLGLYWFLREDHISLCEEFVACVRERT